MRPRIILFGDSITEQSFRPGGWGAALADSYSRKADVILRGYSGYNTRWAMFQLQRIFPLDSAAHPTAVTLFFGANDAALPCRTSERQHVPVDEYRENLKQIILHLKKCSSNMVIVLISPPPVDEKGRMKFAKIIYGEKAMTEPERTNDVTGVYAKNCVLLAKEMGVNCIDIWSQMQETEGWGEFYLSDGLHLTEQGNSIVYENVIKVLAEVGLGPSKVPNDFPHHSQIDARCPQNSFIEGNEL